jgi:hypothetical protein
MTIEFHRRDNAIVPSLKEETLAPATCGWQLSVTRHGVWSGTRFEGDSPLRTNCSDPLYHPNV